MAGKRAFWKAGEVRCTRQCRVTGGIRWMNRLKVSADRTLGEK